MSTFSEDMREGKLFGDRIVGTHQIAEYQLIETGGKDRPRFHIYIDGRRIGHHAFSIDAALITAIAHKHDGLNSQAGHYFARMIDLPE